AEAHGGDVEQRKGIGLAAIGAANGDSKVVVPDRMRHDRMVDPLETAAIDVLLGAERPLVEGALGTLVSHRALRSIERGAVGIALEEILADFRPDLFQSKADVGENGVVAPQTVAGLREVPDADGAGDRRQRSQSNEYAAEGAAERNERRE